MFVMTVAYKMKTDYSYAYAKALSDMRQFIYELQLFGIILRIPNSRGFVINNMKHLEFALEKLSAITKDHPDYEIIVKVFEI